MYLTNISHYLPEIKVNNDFFTQLNGLTEEWIVERTGIRERRKAGANENTATMGIEAAQKIVAQLPFPIEQIDLIIGATYTPHDTICTLAHRIQHAINVPEIPVVTISSACSSLLNAVEIVQGYFAMGKSTKALVVVSEHNTAYYNEKDTVAGHLWGDGATALLITKEAYGNSGFAIVDILTGGAATVGKATESVMLKPAENVFSMPFGRDVFNHACSYMTSASKKIIERNGLTVSDVAFFIPHQANWRITKNVAGQLGLPEERLMSNVQYLGNTGCAGCGIALSENLDKVSTGDNLVMTVFGGGYSYGSMLLKKL